MLLRRVRKFKIRGGYTLQENEHATIPDNITVKLKGNGPTEYITIPDSTCSLTVGDDVHFEGLTDNDWKGIQVENDGILTFSGDAVIDQAFIAIKIINSDNVTFDPNSLVTIKNCDYFSKSAIYIDNCSSYNTVMLKSSILWNTEDKYQIFMVFILMVRLRIPGYITSRLMIMVQVFLLNKILMHI